MKKQLCFIACLIVIFLTRVAYGIDPANYKLVDLTYSYNDQTIYWPTSPTTFKLQRLSYGHTETGFFYSANSFSTPEHGGTHIDAPIHFDIDGQTVDQIPLAQLFVPGVVIDVTVKTKNNRDYRLTHEDVLAFEKEHGEILAGTAVLLRTGWGRYWPDKTNYLGDDTPGDASHLSFPAFGESAARLLIEERNVALIGLDTASIDYGQSEDFIVHRIAAKHNVPGIENIANMEMLPDTGFMLVALPVKIEGGSGGPVRVIALVPKQ